MAILKRIFFFVITNLAVMLVFGIFLSILHIFFPGLTNKTILWSLIISWIVGFLWAFISLWMSRWTAKRLYSIELFDWTVSNDKLKMIYDHIDYISKQENITTPEVGVYESDEVNAFATWATKNSSLVAISTGLLNKMSRWEIEGVISHEMSHIINGDMVTLTLIQGIVNTFVVFISQRIADLVGDENPVIYMWVNLILQFVFGVLWSLIVMYFSRIREYKADYWATKYTDKKNMISALKRLKNVSSSTVTNDQLQTFKISDNSIKDSLWSTHPSLDNRIKALMS